MSSFKHVDSAYSSKQSSHRRTWDKDEYERLARNRDVEERKRRKEEAAKIIQQPQQEKEFRESGEADHHSSDDEAFDDEYGFERRSSSSREPPVKRALLQQRDFKVDLDSKLGKTVVVTKNAPTAINGGYHCEVCDCVVKDSINYLDHINGKKHQRNLGMSMRVERSSLDQVRARLQQNKKKNEEAATKAIKNYNLQQRVKDIKEEEERMKEYRKERKREKKQTSAPNNEMGFNDDMAAIMGFGGFGGSKKN